MNTSFKNKLKKWGAIFSLGAVLIALEKGCVKKKDERTQDQIENDSLVELANKADQYTVSSEYTDKDKGYYSGIVNNIFTNSEVMVDTVYQNKEKCSINESLEYSLKKLGYDKNHYAFFIKNYGSHDNEKMIEWVLRFGHQSETAQQIRESKMKGLVPRTKDKQFWRYTHNSVNQGFFRPTFADTKSYKYRNARLSKEKDLTCPVVYYTGR